MEDADRRHIEAKIAYLEDELESLKFRLPETYQYLASELDIQLCKLKQIQVRELFASIDAGSGSCGFWVFVRSFVRELQLKLFWHSKATSSSFGA